MKIAHIDLGKHPILLAPMEDVTDPAFRLMCKKFGADMVYTEFVSSDALIRAVSKTAQKPVSYTHLDVYKRQIKDTLKKRSFEVEGRQHPLFNSLAGNKIDNLDILFLTDTINTGNTLLENGRIPRQIEIDKYRRNLQIQPCTSGIS